MNPLLVVLNPRNITECMDAFRALDIPKAWMTGYREYDLVVPMADLVNVTDYSHYIVISDDAVVRQPALNAVLALLEDGHPVATGWSNLDCVEAKVNLQRTPLQSPVPLVTGWDLYHFAEVMGYPEPVVPTFFGGMCLTGMSRELWQRFPFNCYGRPGGGSDYHLCWRLQEAGVPIAAAREGFVFHVKERWAEGDLDPKKRLLVGMVSPSVTITD